MTVPSLEPRSSLPEPRFIPLWICPTGAGRLCHRGIGLQNGLSVAIDDPAQTGAAFVATNHEVQNSSSAAALIITQGSTAVSNEPTPESGHAQQPILEAPTIKDICERYKLPYNSGRFHASGTRCTAASSGWPSPKASPARSNNRCKAHAVRIGSLAPPAHRRQGASDATVFHPRLWSSFPSQLKTVIETITDLVHGHRRNARCRQFDSRGDSVEAAANLDDRGRLISCGRREVGPRCGPPGDPGEARRELGTRGPALGCRRPLPHGSFARRERGYSLPRSYRACVRR
jgi:hypothetical protein